MVADIAISLSSLPPLTTIQSVARTYAHPSVADTYDIVRQYRRVMRYPSDASSTAVARKLDLPRGRVRPWLNGGKPDAVRAVETAQKNGWFTDIWTSLTPALAILSIGIFACGSIGDTNYVPSWCPDMDNTRAELTDALKAVNVNSHHQAAREGRSAELKPRSNGSVLGRLLSVIGAPVGSKTAATVPPLPLWVTDAPAELRRRLATLLVRERGACYPHKATQRIQTDRSDAYFQSVAGLIRDVTNEAVTVSSGGVTISAAAARAFEAK